MNLSSYASTWKTPLEEDVSREKSASSFPAIGGTHLSSLQQPTTKGWKQQQRHLQQQKHQQQQTQAAPANDHWGTDGTDSPSMRHLFQPNNNYNHTSNDTKLGWSDQRDTSQHSCGSIWADTASEWSNQRDVSQHSRGGIWTDDHSRSSHTSTSTGTTSYTGTYSSHGTYPFATATAANPTAYSYAGTSSSNSTHPFATATAANHTANSYTGTSSNGTHPFATTTATANPTTTSRINHRHGDPLLGGLGKMLLAGALGRTMPSDDEDDESEGNENDTQGASEYDKYKEKKWLLLMNRRLAEIPVGELDPATIPLSRVMKTWAETKSSEGAGTSSSNGTHPFATATAANHTDNSYTGTSSNGTHPFATTTATANPTTTSRINHRHGDPLLGGLGKMSLAGALGRTMPSDDEDDESEGNENDTQGASEYDKYTEKKWLLLMNRRLAWIPVGELDPATIPLSRVMKTWAETKSSEGASMVEMWLKRAQQEYDAGNHRVVPTAEMYTMAGTSWLL
jgi:hypothetical protein